MTRTTLVTGAAGGIGQALCRTFLAAGDRVLALDRDRAALDRFIGTLADGRATPVVDDLTDAERLCSMLESHPEVDVLVANAGTAASTTLRDTTPASWRTDLDANLTATYVSVEAVLPGIQQDRTVEARRLRLRELVERDLAAVDADRDHRIRADAAPLGGAHRADRRVVVRAE
ncbi:SDR family NAD(P)-dependent oxidoreductase, partial [Burkholderia cenocepacia]|nr:SDR family NAD(P)-dependent oxidoreductase [Burkholderia cenocepacia]